MPKIKILLTIPNFDTAGSGKVVYDLANNLDKELFEIEIACSHDKGKFYPLVEALGLKIHLISTTTSYRPILSLPFKILSIRKFFRKNKFDLIHSWHWSSDWTEALAARLAGIPWIYTKKAMSWGSARNWKIRSRLATVITTINPDMKEHYFKKYKNIQLLPLGLDTDFYSFQVKKYELENLKYSLDDFLVISVVNLIKSKGIEVLVDAAKLVRDPKIKFLIVGDYSSEYGQWVYKKVQEENLIDKIYFTGKVLDVRNYIALSDMFVTPTNINWEGMPMAPVEAMSSGRIVVGTNTSGINYILHDFPNLLVPPNHAQDLADKIIEVKAMTNEARLSLAKKIRNKVITDFSVQQFGKNYGNLYQEILSARN
jgi:glycosyltransferase involved in cell wall biosynthesis